jgi:acylphosphatase
MAASQERLEVYFEGRVQGVGFRYTTSRLSNGYQVSGFVRNLPDGRVHLVVEGESSQTRGMLAEIREVMSENIHDIEQNTAGVTNEFHGFEVR